MSAPQQAINTTAHLVARALRDRQIIATRDNSLGHITKIYEPSRAATLRAVRALDYDPDKLTLYSRIGGLQAYRVQTPAERLDFEAIREAEKALYLRNKRQLCICYLEQAHALISDTGNLFDQAAAAEVLHTVTQLKARFANTTLE